MMPRDLECLESFALVGPGFGGGRPLLVTELRPTVGRSPTLFVAAYEDAPGDSACFDGEVREVEWPSLPPPPRASVRLDDGGHAAGVARIRESIARGDVYQVNLTLRARLPALAPGELLALMTSRGVPRFAAWVRLPDGRELVSASPEMFFAIRDGRIRAEPMKGTHRSRRALAASVKDRAELAMITDLMRNELTQVCRPRSVKVVAERRFIELPYAVQAVSDVEGELLEGLGVREVVGVLHPAGSVTGAPKRAAMELIARLEGSPRGAYCGTLGVTHAGVTTASVLIRTAERRPGGWTYGAGGGIVYDSDAERELDEVRVKLGALGALHHARD